MGPKPPAIPPIKGPNKRAVNITAVSPILMYPPVAGIGICNQYVITKFKAVKIPIMEIERELFGKK
jgi:hypothetical protein